MSLYKYYSIVGTLLGRQFCPCKKTLPSFVVYWAMMSLYKELEHCRYFIKQFFPNRNTIANIFSVTNLFLNYQNTKNPIHYNTCYFAKTSFWWVNIKCLAEMLWYLSPPSHWQKSFVTFGLGSSLSLLVAIRKKYPCQFHWQSFLALAMAFNLLLSNLT